MNIVVLLKQVHDPNIPRTSLRISADARALVLPAGSTPILNGYDGNALEEAIRLKEKSGGVVTALGVGPDGVKDALRRAIAMGADAALHVAGASGLDGDGHVTATLLTAAIQRLGSADLILAGRSASDTDAGIVPLLVAGRLGLPAITAVRTIIRSEDGTLLVERIVEAGVRRLRVRGRAVLAVSNEINKPRNPQLKGVAAAKRAVIPTTTAEELGVALPEPALSLRRLSIPAPPASKAEMISAASSAELGRMLADRLHHEGLI